MRELALPWAPEETRGSWIAGAAACVSEWLEACDRLESEVSVLYRASQDMPGSQVMCG